MTVDLGNFTTSCVYLDRYATGEFFFSYIPFYSFKQLRAATRVRIQMSLESKFMKTINAIHVESCWNDLMLCVELVLYTWVMCLAYLERLYGILVF